MQILSDLDVVRFKVDVRSKNKFSMVKEFTVKPWVHDIVFSIEKVVDMGTLEENANVPMEIDEASGKGKENDETKGKTQQGDMDDEEGRATKKLKSQGASASGENEFQL
jgi:hypothetical protein